MTEQTNPKLGCNQISIAGETMLLVHAGGYKTHLARLEMLGAGQPAVTKDEIKQAPGRYDEAAVGAHIWAERTLCGREWWEMQAADSEKASSTPDCQHCLRIVTEGLASTEPDDRLALVAAMTADIVQSHGCATLFAVPGDQIEACRKAIRKALRERKLRCQTHAVDTTIFVNSDDATAAMSEEQKAAHEAEMNRRIANAMSGRSYGGPTESPEPVDLGAAPWELDWDTWSV